MRFLASLMFSPAPFSFWKSTVNKRFSACPWPQKSKTILPAIPSHSKEKQAALFLTKDEQWIANACLTDWEKFPRLNLKRYGRLLRLFTRYKKTTFPKKKGGHIFPLHQEGVAGIPGTMQKIIAANANFFKHLIDFYHPISQQITIEALFLKLSKC